MYDFYGKFFVTKKQLAAQGRKAMFALKSTMKQLNLNLCTLLSLMVSKFGVPIEDRTLKRFNLEFLRYVLEVRKNTNTFMVHFETGPLPLYSIRIFRMFKEDG